MILKSSWNVHSYTQLFLQTRMIRHYENPRSLFRGIFHPAWRHHRDPGTSANFSFVPSIFVTRSMSFSFSEVPIKQGTILWLKLQHLLIIGLYFLVDRGLGVTRSFSLIKLNYAILLMITTLCFFHTLVHN